MWYHTELNDTVLFEFWTVHGVTGLTSLIIIFQIYLAIFPLIEPLPEMDIYFRNVDHLPGPVRSRSGTRGAEAVPTGVGLSSSVRLHARNKVWKLRSE